MSETLREADREVLWHKPCPFCPIIAGDAPARIIKEGRGYIAFVPLGPHVPGHVVFVPREHIPDATVHPALAGEVFAAAAFYVGRLDVPANIITSVGEAATQSVPHLHIHVVPRGPSDGLEARWPWLATAELVEALECAREQRDDLRELLDAERADRALLAATALTPDEVGQVEGLSEAPNCIADRWCIGGHHSAKCPHFDQPLAARTGARA